MNKANTDSKTVTQCPVIWDSFMESSGLLQRVWVTSPSLPTSVQTVYLLGSSWLHSTAAAVLDGHSMVLASPKLLWSPAASGQHSTNSLSWALFQNSRPATVPNSAALHDFQNQYHLGDQVQLPTGDTPQPLLEHTSQRTSPL